MKKRLNPPPCLLKAWEKNFRYEQSKFINSTYLKEDDLFSQFIFEENTWTICGQMENGDIVCKNEKTNQYFTWDKWKVSQLRHPEKHIYDIMSKKLKRMSKKENKSKECVQLSLCFDELEKSSIKQNKEDYFNDVQIEEVKLVDLDKIEIEFEDEEIEYKKVFNKNDTEDKNKNE